MNPTKRQLLHLALTALAVGALSIPALRPAAAFEPGNVECIAPSGSGRRLGLHLPPGRQVAVRPGPRARAGPGQQHGRRLGGVAYAAVVSKRNEDDNLLIAASTATTTRLAQGAFVGMDMDMVRWLGTVGADYGIIAVAQDSPYQTLPELMEAIKTDPTSSSIAGGPRGRRLGPPARR